MASHGRQLKSGFVRAYLRADGQAGVAAGIAWYEGKRRGLGAELLDEIRTTIRSLGEPGPGFGGEDEAFCSYRRLPTWKKTSALRLPWERSPIPSTHVERHMSRRSWFVEREQQAGADPQTDAGDGAGRGDAERRALWAGTCSAPPR